MYLTLKLKVIVDDQARKSLADTIIRFTESFNRVCKCGWEQPRINGVELHKSTYYDERAKTNLPSQLTVSARMKATEALLSAKTKLKQIEKRNQWRVSKGLKPKKINCPKSKLCPIRYDSHSGTIDLKNGTASLASLNGRQKISLLLSDYHKQRVGYSVKSADLCIDRKQRMFLHVVIDVPDVVAQDNSEIVGIDLGVNRPAVTSDNKFFGFKRWKAIAQRYNVLRTALQAKGTKSAKRHIRKTGRQLNRFRTDCDHVLSKRIVTSVKPGTTIVLEDLTHIRDRVKIRKTQDEQRRRFHSWSFNRLQFFLEYKSKIYGAKVEYIDPRYTSQKCSRCGHIDKKNRITQSWFVCKKCGFQHNADLNAAKTIRGNHQASKGITAAGGLPSPSLSFQPSDCSQSVVRDKLPISMGRR